MYFPRNWEFRSALSKLWNLRGEGLSDEEFQRLEASTLYPTSTILLIN
jgi:hypothetical protein